MTSNEFGQGCGVKNKKRASNVTRQWRGVAGFKWKLCASRRCTVNHKVSDNVVEGMLPPTVVSVPDDDGEQVAQGVLNEAQFERRVVVNTSLKENNNTKMRSSLEKTMIMAMLDYGIACNRIQQQLIETRIQKLYENKGMSCNHENAIFCLTLLPSTSSIPLQEWLIGTTCTFCCSGIVANKGRKGQPVVFVQSDNTFNQSPNNTMTTSSSSQMPRGICFYMQIVNTRFASQCTARAIIVCALRLQCFSIIFAKHNHVCIIY